MSGCGTNAAYQAGCRCDLCRHAHMRAVKAWKLRRAASGGSVLTDPTEWAQRVRSWMDAGWSAAAISQATGVSDQHIPLVATGAHRLTDQTVQRLKHPDWSRVTCANVPAWPSARRLQALRALGWTLEELSALTGLHVSGLGITASGRKVFLRASTAATIRSVYTEIPQTLHHGPHAAAARTTAARMGWAPPAAWDDIDDPDEVPSGIRSSRSRARVANGEAIGRIVELADLGASVTDITTRLHITRATVYSTLQRGGLGDLWDQIRAREEHVA